MGEEAVHGAVGSRLGALILLAVQLQREHSMAGVAGVFDNFLGSSSDTTWCRGPGWQGGMYWAGITTLCSAFTVGGLAVAIPSGDAASQDALSGAAVELLRI